MDLEIPIPRHNPIDYDPYKWPISTTCKLPSPKTLFSGNLSYVLENRQTRRDFREFDLSVLSAFLNWSARTKSFREVNECLIQKRKPVVSAGAIHPIDLLVWRSKDGWFHYNDLTHELGRLELEASLSDSLLGAANHCLSISDGTLIVFIAEPGKTGVLYKNPWSLVWRDAGALIGHMSIVAESLKCSFCPLGLTGEPYVSQLDSELRLSGVGMAVLG